MSNIIAYKSFGPDWKCRDFQYEVGKTYKHEGDVKLCKSGFHACEYPIDIFLYYQPTGQMAQVELGEVAAEKDTDDSKRVGGTITLQASLTIPMLVSAAVEYTTKRCDPVKAKHSTGDSSASSATGKFAVAAAFGLDSKAKAGQDGAVIVAWLDRKSERIRYTTGYVGEDGIKADTWYGANDAGKLIEV